MDRIATGPATDRRDLFSETASRLGMNPAIVEKDFWVCWILKHLFAEPTLKGQMVFKGGTSLSKVFGLIDRFSEDIDLILDWRLLGYGHAEGSDPYQAIQSKTKQSRYNQKMNAKAAEYIRGTLLGHPIRDVRIHLFRVLKRTIAIADDVEVSEVKIGCEPRIDHALIMKDRWPKRLLCPTRMQTCAVENIAVTAGQPRRSRCQPG
jgi:hypothetical protein